VIDSGIGISEEDRDKLFKPFQQANKGIQKTYGGTGLGLWVTQKLISLMKGEIKVYSELGKGSRFVITLPVQAYYTQEEKPAFGHYTRLVSPVMPHRNLTNNSLPNSASLGIMQVKVLLFA